MMDPTQLPSDAMRVLRQAHTYAPPTGVAGLRHVSGERKIQPYGSQGWVTGVLFRAALMGFRTAYPAGGRLRAHCPEL